ncbi:MAG: hypothetical protein JW801_05855 [Bacteroidales bacterium]|nr:hypothetical protein [Bacteroidales bacterium]
MKTINLIATLVLIQLTTNLQPAGAQLNHNEKLYLTNKKFLAIQTNPGNQHVPAIPVSYPISFHNLHAIYMPSNTYLQEIVKVKPEERPVLEAWMLEPKGEKWSKSEEEDLQLENWMTNPESWGK